jgi:hypothetical protein
LRTTTASPPLPPVSAAAGDAPAPPLLPLWLLLLDPSKGVLTVMARMSGSAQPEDTAGLLLRKDEWVDRCVRHSSDP